MKPDYLKECMSEVGNVPLDQFNQIYCLRCGNQECARSKVSNSFESRVKTWEDRLFRNPPRAADDDPRFDNIRAKNFRPIGQQSLEIHDTQQIPITPLKEENPKPAPEPPPPLPKPEAVAPKPAVQPKPAPAPPAPASPPTPPNIGNTAFNQGAMIGGSPPTEKVLEPGGTFTFGDDQES